MAEDTKMAQILRGYGGADPLGVDAGVWC